MSDNNNEETVKTTNPILSDSSGSNPTTGTVLKRKPKTYLDAAWLCNTAKLALNYDTKIIFDKQGRVFGVPSDCGGSVAVFYPPNKEWIDYVLSLFPEGAIFSGCDLLTSRESKLTLKSYGNLTLPEDGTAKCWVDEIKNTVIVESNNVKIKSGVLCPYTHDLDLRIPDEIPELNLSEILQKKDIDILLACVLKNGTPNTREMCRINRTVIDGKVSLFSTNRHALVFHTVEAIPEGFTINPSLVDIYRVRGYSIVDESNGKDNLKRQVQSFKMDDNCVIVEAVGVMNDINVGYVVSGVKNNQTECVVKRETLSDVFSECSRLGLFSTDTWLAVCIRNGLIYVRHGEAEVASFEIACDAPENTVYTFNPSLIEPALKIGGDFCFCLNKPLVVSDEKTTFIAMPLRIE